MSIFLFSVSEYLFILSPYPLHGIQGVIIIISAYSEEVACTPAEVVPVADHIPAEDMTVVDCRYDAVVLEDMTAVECTHLYIPAKAVAEDTDLVAESDSVLLLA